jgi:hypothetical protein
MIVAFPGAPGKYETDATFAERKATFARPLDDRQPRLSQAADDDRPEPVQAVRFHRVAALDRLAVVSPDYPHAPRRPAQGLAHRIDAARLDVEPFHDPPLLRPALELLYHTCSEGNYSAK